MLLKGLELQVVGFELQDLRRVAQLTAHMRAPLFSKVCLMDIDVGAPINNRLDALKSNPVR